MTQKKRPLSPQPDHIQSSYFPPEDEIGLPDLLEVLIRKKILIIAITSVFTVFAILYAQSVTPTYRAEIGFLPAGEVNLAAYFPESIAHVLPGRAMFDDVTNKNKSLFYMFLTTIQSYQLQEKVFIEGNFVKRFVDNNPNVDMRKQVFLGLNGSMQINTDNKGKKTGAKDARNSFDETIYLEMVGTKPEVISDFLNALAEAAKNEVINNTKKSIQSEINAQINNYSIKLENLRVKDKSEKAQKIRDLSGNLEIAKKLGVVENSFSLVSKNMPATFVFQQGEESRHRLQWEQSLPLWYLYGERALQQELDSLKSRLRIDAYSEEADELNFGIASLSKIDLPKINFQPVIVSQPSIPPAHPFKPDKIKIIGLGVPMGLFIGFLAAFLSNTMGQLRARQSSTQEE